MPIGRGRAVRTGPASSWSTALGSPATRCTYTPVSASTLTCQQPWASWVMSAWELTDKGTCGGMSPSSMLKHPSCPAAHSAWLARSSALKVSTMSLSGLSAQMSSVAVGAGGCGVAPGSAVCCVGLVPRGGWWELAAVGSRGPLLSPSVGEGCCWLSRGSRCKLSSPANLALASL